MMSVGGAVLTSESVVERNDAHRESPSWNATVLYADHRGRIEAPHGCRAWEMTWHRRPRVSSAVRMIGDEN